MGPDVCTSFSNPRWPLVSGALDAATVFISSHPQMSSTKELLKPTWSNFSPCA
ncbi:unnamed protein product, partial [Gulo gulo]